MEKKRYYVTLRSGITVGEIRDEEANASYDFALEATPVEIDEMRQMFDHATNSDMNSWFHSHIPYTNLTDLDNEAYDDNLVAIYRRIYQLGTPETKEQMEELGLVERLKLNRKSPSIY